MSRGPLGRLSDCVQNTHTHTQRKKETKSDEHHALHTREAAGGCPLYPLHIYTYMCRDECHSSKAHTHIKGLPVAGSVSTAPVAASRLKRQRMEAAAVGTAMMVMVNHKVGGRVRSHSLMWCALSLPL